MKRSWKLRSLIVLTLLTLAISYFAVGIVNAQALIWVATSNPSGSTDVAANVAVGPTGVYVVGYDMVGWGNARWRTERRNPANGALLAFATFNPSGLSDVANGVAVDGTGVYIVGYDMVGGNARWRIEKRSLLGLALLWVQVSNPSGFSDMPFEVAVGPTGVYVVGYDRALVNPRWRIERRSPANGALLAVATPNPSAGDDMAYAVALDGTGVYIVGYDMVGGDHRWRIEKRSLLGLGLLWVATSDPSGLYDRAYDVAVGPSGVYVVGYDMVGLNARWRIERRSPANGALLAAPAISNPSAGHDYAYGVAVGPTGIYVVGTDRFGVDPRWIIEKRALLGLGLIWRVAIDPSPGTDEARKVALDGTGIYVVGSDQVPGNLRWRIEKRTL